MRFALVFEDTGHGDLWGGEPDDSAGRDGGEEVRVHFPMVRLRGGRERNHPRVLLEEQKKQAFSICLAAAEKNGSAIGTHSLLYCSSLRTRGPKQLSVRRIDGFEQE